MNKIYFDRKQIINCLKSFGKNSEFIYFRTTALQTLICGEQHADKGTLFIELQTAERYRNEVDIEFGVVYVDFLDFLLRLNDTIIYIEVRPQQICINGVLIMNLIETPSTIFNSFTELNFHSSVGIPSLYLQRNLNRIKHISVNTPEGIYDFANVILDQYTMLIHATDTLRFIEIYDTLPNFYRERIDVKIFNRDMPLLDYVMSNVEWLDIDIRENCFIFYGVSTDEFIKKFTLIIPCRGIHRTLYLPNFRNIVQGVKIKHSYNISIAEFYQQMKRIEKISRKNLYYDSYAKLQFNNNAINILVEADNQLYKDTFSIKNLNTSEENVQLSINVDLVKSILDILIFCSREGDVCQDFILEIEDFGKPIIFTYYPTENDVKNDKKAQFYVKIVYSTFTE